MPETPSIDAAIRRAEHLKLVLETLKYALEEGDEDFVTSVLKALETGDPAFLFDVMKALGRTPPE